MISDDVTRFDEVASNVRTLLHVAPDQKKSRAYVIPRKNFQQTQRVRIIGTVVVGECYFLAVASDAGERAPVPLTRGRHRLISCSDCGERRTTSQAEAEHARIVAD